MELKNILNNNAPIGFFDSGVGGLTVLNKVKRLMPEESFIFYGDTLHVPYGDKTKEQLLDYSKNILKFFEIKGCKAVVMACNTTSSVIYDDIKNSYSFKLYPVVQSVAKILADYDIERLGVFATKATINSQAYSREIHKYNQNMNVFGQYCPNWVSIVEENLTQEPESISIVKKDFDKMLKNSPEKIVLGCTHYPFLLNILTEFAPADMFIDPAIFLAEYIKEDLAKNNLLCPSNPNRFEEFYVSSNPAKFKSCAKMFYELTSNPELKIF